MSDEKELENWLDRVSDKVSRNVTIVTPKDIDQDYFLHISKDISVKEFIPFISKRQGDKEDRTIARITVAPMLLGCMIGYANDSYDFLNLIPNGKSEELGYRGGYKIYSVPFKAAIKPANKLVYDSKNSDEHWLVTYSKETVTYKPEPVGKMFYRGIMFVPRKDKLPFMEGTLYVEVTKEEGIPFSKNIFLNKGYHIIDGPIQNHIYSWKDDKVFKVRQIDKAEYLLAKNQSAALLGFTEPVPSYLSW